MKYVLYGLPCSGKTTLLNELSIPVIHGSTELNKMASGRFSELLDNEKNNLRIRYAKNLLSRTDSFISDGHYSFINDVVFTEADGNLYEVFIYLYCKPKDIAERIKTSHKNSRFSSLTAERIRKWQDFETENLRMECHKRNKDFYVIYDIAFDELQAFIDRIENGFISFGIAKRIADKIMKAYPVPCELHICDGDKTIIRQDSFRACNDGYITHTFDDNFYTGFQALKFTEEMRDIRYNTDMLSDIQLNNELYNIISDKNYIVLSSGISSLWEKISEMFGLKNIIADTLISADTKYYTVKLLQEKGYKIVAYGDSKNDYYMLRQADKGYLYIGSYLSRSLRNTDLSGIKLIYNKSPYILADHCTEIKDDIEICKSDSGISGSKLADAHIRLGRKLGQIMREFIPDKNTAVIVLERGGRFFGDGLYSGFGGTFYSYDPKRDELPDLPSDTVIIVDSVINTGKSILDTVEKLRQKHPDMEIFIAANVIQEKAIYLLNEYKVFAIRTSANSFIGSRQTEQKNGKGPDTADRLYNYLY